MLDQSSGKKTKSDTPAKTNSVWEGTGAQRAQFGQFFPSGAHSRPRRHGVAGLTAELGNISRRIWCQKKPELWFWDQHHFSTTFVFKIHLNQSDLMILTKNAEMESDTQKQKNYFHAPQHQIGKIMELRDPGNIVDFQVFSKWIRAGPIFGFFCW